MTIRRDLSILACAVLLVALAIAGTRPAAAEALPVLEPSPCETEALTRAGAECHRFRVPEDHDDPASAVVTLPVAVLEPEAGAAADEAVFFFPGGPGYSILDAPGLIDQYRRDVGDRTLVLLDHRGMRHATPSLRCPPYAEVSPYHDVLFTPAVTAGVTVRERAEILTRAVAACHDRLLGEGVDLAQYNSHAIARDVDALRRTLGYARIDLYGRSTGGGTALAYLKYFPDSVRAAVLVSPWYANLRNRAAIDELHAAKQTYTDVLGLCVREDAACREALPAWLLAVERARRSLDARPFVATVGEGEEQETLYFDGVGLLHALYARLPEIYDALPGYLTAIHAGDDAPLAELFALDRWSPTTEAPRYALGYFLAHICNDMGRNKPTREDVLAMLEREPALLGFEPPWTCGWWDTVGDVPDRHSHRLHADTPVLSLHGEMDPCCGKRWGAHLAETMPNVRVVELQALGHTPDSACGTRLMAAFLHEPNQPLDTSCSDDVARRPWKLH